MKNRILFLSLALLLVVGVVAVAAQDKSDCAGCESTKDATVTAEDQGCQCGQAECVSCQAAMEKAGNQTVCPVMGGEINKDFFVDRDGKRVYFCCEGCIKTFNENPQKYLEKMKSDGVKLEVVPQKDQIKKT